VNSKKQPLSPVKGVDVFPTKQPPVIDGALTDPCWKNTAKINGFVLVKTMNTPPKEKTEVCFAYDKQNLYIAASLMSKNSKKLKATMTERDQQVWQDDDFEILIDAENDYKTFKQILINSIGTIQDISLAFDQVADAIVQSPKWNPKIQKAVQITKNSWNVEMSIPWKEIGVTPRIGEYIGIQIGRCNPTIGEYSSFSPTDKFPDASSFGFLRFRKGKTNSTIIDSVRLSKSETGELQYIDVSFTSTINEKRLIEAIITDPYTRKSKTTQTSSNESENVETTLSIKPGNAIVDGKHKLAIRIINAKSGDTEAVFLGAFDQTIPSPVKFGETTLCPNPKSVKWTKGTLLITSSMKIFTSQSPSAHDKHSADFLAKEIYGYFGLKLAIIASPKITTQNTILIANSNFLEEKSNIATISDQNAQLQDIVNEGYALTISPEKIAISGKDPAGLFYGATTVSQIMRSARIRTEREVKTCEILDWPDTPQRMVLQWRGTTFTNNSARNFNYDEFKFDTLRMLAESKINHYFFMSAAGIAYEREINKKITRHSLMTIRQFKELASFCNENFIDLSPMLHCTSHSDWSFLHAYPKMKEGDDNWQSDVLHPKFYDRVFPLMSELIDATGSKYFHVCEDEWWHKGHITPTRNGMPRKNIFRNHILKLYDFLKQKNVKMVMFSDMLLPSHNGRAPLNVADIASELPQDIIMSSWSGGVKGTQLLKGMGFEVLATMNGARLLPAKQKNLISGYGVLTYANYMDHASETKSSYILSSFHQILRGADYAWNLNHDSELPMAEWVRIYGKNIMAMNSVRHNPTASDKFKVIDLGICANAPNSKNAAIKCDYKNIPSGPVKIGFIPMQLLPQNKKNAKSYIQAQKEKITINIGEKFSSLIFLQAAIDNPEEKIKSKRQKSKSDNAFKTYTIGLYEVAYEDETTSLIEVNFGLNTYNWKPKIKPARFLAQTRYVWDLASANGDLASLYQYEWVNPTPKKRIKSIKIRLIGTKRTPVLFALTGRIPIVEESN
jgi:hypothetical protein